MTVQGTIKKYRWLIAGLLIVVCVLCLVYGLKWLAVGGQGDHQNVPLTRVYRAPITKGSGAILDLAAFVVLLPEDEDWACLSLSISVKLSNSRVGREIKEKKPFFRGVIYDVLDKAVKTGSSQTISKEQLKRDVIGALNGLLVTGSVDAIYYREFLLV
ncbi:MAG: hypothetical protein KAV83_01300 [Desulfobacterales bacterium]|nr:hypothetical protein [Desulfobacterales bacterium]